jgi:hypothetical protein
MAALQFPHTLEFGMLNNIEPQKWLNVGPNVSLAFELVVQQLKVNGKNFIHI